MTKPIEEIYIKDASEFFNFTRLSNKIWWDNDGSQSWVFRGNKDSRFGLIPSGLRNFSNVESIYNYQRKSLFEEIEKLVIENYTNGNFKNRHPPGSHFPDDETTIRTHIWSAFVYFGFSAFVTCASDHGFVSTAKNFSEQSKKSAIASSYHASFSQEPNSPEEMALWALAQHHGIPTFLLDWTYKPHFAAFFACEGWIGGQPTDIVIWAFNEKRFHTFRDSLGANSGHDYNYLLAFGSKLIRTPYSENEYIRSQKGVFTWIRSKLIDVSTENERWMGSEEIIKDYDVPSSFIKKIILDAQCVPELKDILKREGISRAMLMPSLDNIAITAMQNW